LVPRKEALIPYTATSYGNSKKIAVEERKIVKRVVSIMLDSEVFLYIQKM